MKAVNVRQLKHNPSNALRLAREDPVVVMSREGIPVIRGDTATLRADLTRLKTWRKR